MKTSKIVTALNAVVATTTSSSIDVKYAKKITIMLTQADHSSGNFVVTVTGSIDGGTTFITLNNLRDNTTGVLTLVASKTISTNTSDFFTIDLRGTAMALTNIQITGTRTTDGTLTAVVYIEE